VSVYARVAVPRPLQRTFLYHVPPDLAAEIGPGCRVVVPFGRKQLTGWVDELVSDPEDLPDRVRDVLDLPDTEPVFDEDLLTLCRWVARYYVAPLGLVFRAALPAALTAESAVRLHRTDAPAPDVLGSAERKLLDSLDAHKGPVKLSSVRKSLGRGSWAAVARRLAEQGLLALAHEAADAAPPARTRQVITLTRELASLQERDRVFARAPRQRELFEYLESVDGRSEVAHVVDRLGISRSVVEGLVGKGLAEVQTEELRENPFADLPVIPEPDHQPSPAQRRAIAALLEACAADEPGVFVLKGVTGSGKTLVYIETLRELVGKRGRAAILLVPEISLTPQTLSRFRAAFGDAVALLHSALSDGERYTEWRAVREGKKRIVIGARSAVFAPVVDLGAIIIDEEHEGSYKQSDPTPRYHARDVAVMRAQRAGALCLLGSATPSLESWHHTAVGSWELIELPERVRARPLPEVQIVDLREERDKAATGGDGHTSTGPLVISSPLAAALAERFERGEQAILLLNRRGYANFVQCRECGSVRVCWQCNVSLTRHRRPPRLVCHHCNHHEALPDACPECGSPLLSERGVGTEQLERVLGDLFPDIRIARMDVDTTSGKWSHHEILGRVARGEVDALLGTQMIAKGLDFPNVTLVGVVNADVGLSLPDFRAAERTFQLLTQVAGRAGRGSTRGDVIIQTALPQHYAVSFAIEHDYEGFAARELEERDDPGYPPHTRLANLVVSGRDELHVQTAAEATRRWLAGLIETHQIQGIRMLGPAPCPIDRIRGRWRWHLLLKSREADALGPILRYFAERFEPPGGGELRVEIDRDPVSLL